ncbi:L-glyceraldehyde 3-phosphate reductase [compost metagenome]
MQDHYNLIYREEEREMLPLCTDQKIAVIPYSPYAKGRLTRDWQESTHRSETDQVQKSQYGPHEAADRVVVERVASVAEARGVSRAQVALAWILAKDPVTAPIIGVTKLPQLDDAIAALSLSLTSEEIAYLEEPYIPHPYIGFQ